MDPAQTNFLFDTFMTTTAATEPTRLLFVPFRHSLTTQQKVYRSVDLCSFVWHFTSHATTRKRFRISSPT